MTTNNGNQDLINFFNTVEPPTPELETVYDNIDESSWQWECDDESTWCEDEDEDEDEDDESTLYED
jgi:hypothetical protein